MNTNNNRNPFINFPEISPREMAYLKEATTSLSEEQLRDFTFIYSGKRKKAQDILLMTLLGFLGIAGIQRFMLGQIGMGIIYFLTCGFCFIGTIIDLINHKSMTDEHNRKMISESMMVISGNQF